VPKQDNFKAKHGLSLMLASDESHERLEAYGVWAKHWMWGRCSMGILRNTYLIRPDGRIARIWEKAKVKGHAEEVLQAAKEL
jgi:peroxiredoxin Q/BCP